MKRQRFTGEKGYTIADTRYEYEVTDRTPEGAPNVVYIVMDDLGFAQLGCYGSHIHTPNINRLANEGVRFNNFHTTAICSATRASLLTGMNHHSAGVGTVMEFSTGCSNTAGHIHHDCATIAEILKEYDYGTFACGKWHLNSVEDTTEAGPYDEWPLGRGFDKYYGFLHCQMDQFHPRLVQDNQPVKQPKTPEEGYHFSEDVTDKAIKYIFHQKVVYPEKPFFLYLAYGAMHMPHHAPKEYIDKYKGKFDAGWDAIREQWFARQKELGLIPQDAKLTPRNELVPAWDTLSENQKKASAKYMEAFAGMLEHTDAQIGRLLDYLEEAGELDNTVIVFLSDNGTSAEGGRIGSFNGHAKAGTFTENDIEAKAVYTLKHADEVGGPNSYNHYAVGWANAGNTPFPWYKMWSYSGGVKDPLIVRYPKAIHDPGTIRTQYHHVSDITPTVLELLGVEKPESIKGVHQRAFEGTSFKYALENAGEPDRKHVQYYEMLGNRAIYKDGWKAIVNHAFNGTDGDYEADRWELYHVAEDYSEYEDVADKYPDKVKDLERTWVIEAATYDVFPMFDGAFYGTDKAMQKLNQGLQSKERFLSYRSIIEPFEVIRPAASGLSSHSHAVRATVARDSVDQQGAIFTFGNYHGGFVLYIKDNYLKFAYNQPDVPNVVAVSKEELPLGEVTVEYRIKYHKNFTATVILLVNGEVVAESAIERLLFSTEFITTVGANKYSPVAPEDYDSPFIFEGHIKALDILVDGETSGIDQELEAFFATE